MWQLGLDKSGYGSMAVMHEGKQQRYRAHRIAYAMLVGPIPEGLVIDHLCRVRNCVNPSHMEPVTHAENIKRIPYTASYVDQCKWAHGEDSWVTKSDGSRSCNRCSKARQRAYRLGISTKEAIQREDELDVTMARTKPHNPNPEKPRKVFVDWTKPQCCADCSTRLRRRQDPKEKGVLLFAGRGRCGKCLKVVLYGEKYNTTAYHVDNSLETP